MTDATDRLREQRMRALAALEAGADAYMERDAQGEWHGVWRGEEQVLRMANTPRKPHRPFYLRLWDWVRGRG